MNTNTGDLLDQGKQLRQEGKLEEAIKKYSIALETEPNFVPALNQLAQIYKSQEKFVRAISYYQHITKLRPKNGQFHVKLAAMLMCQGRIQEAIEAYQKAIALEPERPEWVYHTKSDFKNSCIMQGKLKI